MWVRTCKKLAQNNNKIHKLFRTIFYVCAHILLFNCKITNILCCMNRISICIGTFGVCECIWRLVGAVWHSAVLCSYSGCNCHCCIWMHRWIYISNHALSIGLHCAFVICKHCPFDLYSAAVQFLWLHWDAAQEVHTGRDDWREWAELHHMTEIITLY